MFSAEPPRVIACLETFIPETDLVKPEKADINNSVRFSTRFHLEESYEYPAANYAATRERIQVATLDVLETKEQAQHWPGEQPDS